MVLSLYLEKNPTETFGSNNYGWASIIFHVVCPGQPVCLLVMTAINLGPIDS